MPADRPRFGLDAAATVFDYPPGVRRVCSELVAGLSAHPALEALPLVPAADDDPRAWRNRELPRLERELDLTGLVSFTSAFPLRGRGARIQLIHELPWRHGATENAGWRHKLWARHGWRRAGAIVVPSGRVLADLEDESKRAARKAQVIPWGVSAAFGLEPGPRDEATLLELGLAGTPFFLMAGATRPKKRVDLAVTALLSVLDSDARLVVTGALDASISKQLTLARNLGLEGRLVYTGELAEAALATLNRHAIGALSLADSEGFGLGTLEALASGTPVVVRPASAPAEIAGPHAIEADDPESIGAALRKWVDSPSTKAERAARATHAERFSWKRAADDLAELLIAVAASRT